MATPTNDYFSLLMVSSASLHGAALIRRRVGRDSGLWYFPSDSRHVHGGVRVIFISYRREDSVGHAGRIFDRLAEQLGRDQVCRDIDSLPPGEDFVLAIKHIVKQSHVLLALIGPGWITATDDD